MGLLQGMYGSMSKVCRRLVRTLNIPANKRSATLIISISRKFGVLVHINNQVKLKVIMDFGRCSMLVSMADN